MNRTIHYSDGRTIKNPVVQVWDDNHEERSGFFRAFWCADKDATTGSTVIGYCSAGGSHRTIRAVATEVWQLYPDAVIYRNGREVKRPENAHAFVAHRDYATSCVHCGKSPGHTNHIGANQ